MHEKIDDISRNICHGKSMLQKIYIYRILKCEKLILGKESKCVPAHFLLLSGKIF